MRRWVEGLDRDLVDRELAADLCRLEGDIIQRRSPLLPRGVVHGDLFMNNTKWRRGTLDAVFDWEMAGTDHLLLDLAITCLAWGFKRGDDGGIEIDNIRACIAGYASVRRLHESEIRGAYAEFLLAGLRFCASRVRDFHLDQEQGRELGDRVFLDYREYSERIDAIVAWGPRFVRDLVRDASQSQDGALGTLTVEKA